MEMKSFLLAFLTTFLVLKALRVLFPKNTLTIDRLYVIITRSQQVYVTRVIEQSYQFDKRGYQLEVLDNNYKRIEEIWLPVSNIASAIKL